MYKWFVIEDLQTPLEMTVKSLEIGYRVYTEYSADLPWNTNLLSSRRNDPEV